VVGPAQKWAGLPDLPKERKWRIIKLHQGHLRFGTDITSVAKGVGKFLMKLAFLPSCDIAAHAAMV